MISFDAWDTEKAKANQKDHGGVTFEEAKAVFEDANALTITDYESDPNEERFITIGMGNKARVLVVVYTYRSEKIRIISARKANPRERKEYGGK